jgi:hypothetical protein
MFVEKIEGLPYSTTHIELSTLSMGFCNAAIICALMMMRGEKVRWWWLVGVVGCLAAAVVGNG